MSGTAGRKHKSAGGVVLKRMGPGSRTGGESEVRVSVRILYVYLVNYVI